MKKYKERVDKNSTLTMGSDPSGTRPLPHSRLYLIGQNASIFAMLGGLTGCVCGLFMLDPEIGSYVPVFTGLTFAAVGTIFGAIVGAFTKLKKQPEQS